MSGIAVKTKPNELAPEVPLSKVPEVDPGSVTRNSGGFCFQSWFARMPEHMTIDDIREPRIWKRVQSTRDKSFRRHDTVRLVAFDESWTCDALVTDATADQAVLAPSKLFDLPPRFNELYQDAKYRVRWYGVGFAAERKSDGMKMTPIVHTPEAAVRDLNALYPRPA